MAVVSPVRRVALLFAAAACAASMAAGKQPAEPQVDQVGEAPADRKAFYDTVPRGGPQVQWVTFFRPGTNESLDSVPAGQRFDVEILLDRRAPQDVEVTLTSFRLDASGLGSGQVKVIPIVVGSGADEKYWGTQPPSPVTVRRGSFGVRVRNAGRVLPTAKQPPGGDATKPFAPVTFPDHVILFAKHGDSVLAPTLRVTAP